MMMQLRGREEGTAGLSLEMEAMKPCELARSSPLLSFQSNKLFPSSASETLRFRVGTRGAMARHIDVPFDNTLVSSKTLATILNILGIGLGLCVCLGGRGV